MPLLFTIIVSYILAGAEVDLFVPSFPELQDVFHLTPFMVELTLTVNLIAHCFSCLIVGNLGDRYGYRPIILLGLSIFVIGSIFCAFANSYEALLFGRFLQGVGVSGASVLAYVVIADIYSTARQQEIMGVLNGVITFAMAFAPVVGSYVSLLFHWRGNFIALLTLGVINLILCCLFIPKSNPNPTISLSLKEYKAVLSSRKTMLFIFFICFACLPYWIFIGISPILYMDDLGVSLELFGYYQGSMCVVFSIASFTSGYFIRKFGQSRCLNFGLSLIVIFMIICFFLLIFNINDPLIITLNMLILALGIVYPINILYPMSYDELPNAKGKTSALIMGSRLVFTGIGLQVVSYLYHGSFRELGWTMIILFIVMFAILYRLIYQEKIRLG